MKQILSICISILVLIGTFSDAFVYLTFKLNQDKIADELCINLDEPELMCKGKCFLDDQLAKINATQSDEKGQTPVKFEKKDIPFFFKSNKLEAIASSSYFKSTERPVLADIISYETHLKGVFHPPQV